MKNNPKLTDEEGNCDNMEEHKAVALVMMLVCVQSICIIIVIIMIMAAVMMMIVVTTMTRTIFFFRLFKVNTDSGRKSIREKIVELGA